MFIDPPQGAPSEWRHSLYQINSEVTISASYLNTTFFIGNAQKTRTLTEFSPRNLLLPNAITPKQVIRHHRVKRRGRSVGHARVLSLILPVLFISSPDKRNSTEPFLFIKNFLLIHHNPALLTKKFGCVPCYYQFRRSTYNAKIFSIGLDGKVQQRVFLK